MKTKEKTFWGMHIAFQSSDEQQSFSAFLGHCFDVAPGVLHSAYFTSQIYDDYSLGIQPWHELFTAKESQMC